MQQLYFKWLKVLFRWNPIVSFFHQELQFSKIFAYAQLMPHKYFTVSCKEVCATAEKYSTDHLEYFFHEAVISFQYKHSYQLQLSNN